MQFSAVEIRFIVTTLLYSTFANDLKRKYFFSKNVHSYRVCSFKLLFFQRTNDKSADHRIAGWSDIAVLMLQNLAPRL